MICISQVPGNYVDAFNFETPGIWIYNEKKSHGCNIKLFLVGSFDIFDHMPLRSRLTDKAFLKIYHGYGHTHSLFVWGHLFLNEPPARSLVKKTFLGNFLYFARRYTSRTISGAQVQMIWRNQTFLTKTENDGFFQFHWKSDTEVEAGWHEVEIRLLARQRTCARRSKGTIYVPHITQFVFISDIDDTIQVSHSANPLKKLTVLLTSTPGSRKTFHDVGRLYSQFSQAGCSPAALNPFFYISNSEWNLYDDIIETFEYNGLPVGVCLLSHLKRWFGLLNAGTAQGNTKIRRASRILDTFNNQKFVLLGDDSQKDPQVYASLVDMFPGRIFAVYLREISSSRNIETKRSIERMNRAGTHTCLFSTTDQALAHARGIELI